MRSFNSKYVPKPMSLRNVRSSCYINSAFQAISSCSNFVNDISHLQSDYRNLEMLKALNDLLKILSCGDSDFGEIISNKIFCNWNKSGQQDCFDLLLYAINQIFDEIKKHMNCEKSFSDWLKVKVPLRITLKYMFKGCKTSNHLQVALALHIPIPSKCDEETTLQKLFDEYFNFQTIADYPCENENCNETHCLFVRLCFPVPKTLCIHLQRSYFDGGIMRKAYDRVKFSNQLIIKNKYIEHDTEQKTPLSDCNETDNEDLIYCLKSVIVHFGNLNFGHYVCYKLFNDLWFCADDSNIYQVNFETVLQSKAYVLFYELFDKKLTENLENDINKIYEDSDDDNNNISKTEKYHCHLSSESGNKGIQNHSTTNDRNLSSNNSLETTKLTFENKLNTKRFSLYKMKYKPYLKFCLHALSSSQQLSAEIYQIFNFLPKMSTTSIDYNNVYLPNPLIQRLNNNQEFDLFIYFCHVLWIFLQNLENSQIQTTNLKCYSCHFVSNFKSTNTRLNISIKDYSAGDVQSLVNMKFFDIEDCKNIFCSDCQSEESQLCFPYPKITCIHIENIISKKLEYKFNSFFKEF